MPRHLPIAAVLVVLAGGCGGEASRKAAEPARTPARADAPAATPAPRAAGARGVIDGWARAVARSDTAAAARYFAVPALVSQARAVRLTSRAEIRAFNATLPCGADLLGIRRDGRYVVGSFRLKERPGQRCDGPGARAEVAFVLRGGRIAEWRRVVEQAPAPGESA